MYKILMKTEMTNIPPHGSFWVCLMKKANKLSAFLYSVFQLK